MTKRAKKSATNRLRKLNQELRKAKTPEQELWRACAALVSEAGRADQVPEATNAVLELVAELMQSNNSRRTAA